MSSAAESTDSKGPCRVCGASSRRLFPARDLVVGAAPEEAYRITRMSYSTPFEVQRCERCGLGWAIVPHDASAILAVYGDGEDPTYTEEEAGRRATFRRGLEWVAEQVPSGRLLDVGASVGFLLAEARDLGYEITGVEPSRWAAEAAHRKFGIELAVGGIEAAEVEQGSVDVMTMVDVIEHLVDPFAVLAQVARLLRPGGALYLVTPDLGGLPARILGRRWWGFEPWHLWFFTHAAMASALAAADLELVASRSYSRTFSLGYWMRKGEGLSRSVARPLLALADRTGLGGRPVTLDLRDTLEVVARRRERTS